MLAEASPPGAPSEAVDRPTGPSAAAAAVTTVLLVTVAFVPALSPEAAAAPDPDTCLPPDPRVDPSLVVDRSGSMSGAKLADAKDGAVGFVENLTDNDQSGLVSYNTSATLDAELSFDHGDTIQAIEDLTADGGTATGHAIDLSHADLAEGSRPGVTPTMIVLSDGHTNAGPDPVAEAEEAKADGVEIFTIAFGDGANETGLREIASDPVETHFYNTSSGDLEAVYDQILEEANDVDVHAAEAFGVQVDVATDQAVQQASLHKTPQALAPPDQEDERAGDAVEAAGLTVEVASGDVEARGHTSLDTVRAEARSRIADLRIHDGSGTLMEADLLAASAQARSSLDDQGTSADGTRLAGVAVQGTPVAAPIPPDTTVPLGEKGSVTLNEQVTTQEEDNVTLRVNLVHLTIEDGPRTLDVTVGSAYAAATCGSVPSYTPPEDADRGVSRELADDNRSVGPANVNPGGEAENGEHDCRNGEPCTAVSGDGDAGNAGDECAEESPCTAASGHGDARNAEDECNDVSPCTAASATGAATNAEDEDCYLQSPCTAASGTGDARNAGYDCTDVSPCTAASGTGDAQNAGDDCNFQTPCVAASGTGDATNSGRECRLSPCVAASGTGDATNAAEDCDLAACLAVSGTGDATNAQGDCTGVSACVAASGTGNASGTVAASGTGNASGFVAVSGGHPSDPVHVGALDCGAADCAGVAVEDDAEGALVAATLVGNASGPVAASGTGDARNAEEDCEGQATACVAVSGTGDADNAHEACDFSATGTNFCVAASGTGDAEGEHTAFSGTGNASGFLVAGGTGSCDGRPCHDVNASGPARGHNTAVSGNGSADARQGAAASGTGPASTSRGAAVSGTGSATSYLGPAVSGTGEADSPSAGGAVSGTGPAHTFIGPAVSGTGDAEAGIGPAVSGTGDADTWVGVALSGTGEASVGVGAAASGCSGVKVGLLVAEEQVASPAPVCSTPAAEAAPLLP